MYVGCGNLILSRFSYLWYVHNLRYSFNRSTMWCWRSRISQGLDVGSALLFGVWFPEERRSKEGTWTEGRGSTCPSLIFSPTSSSSSCTCIPPMVVAHGPSVYHSPLLTHIHQCILTNVARELRSVWRKCLHPPMAPCAYSVMFLSWPPRGPQCSRSISFPSH